MTSDELTQFFALVDNGDLESLADAVLSAPYYDAEGHEATLGEVHS